MQFAEAGKKKGKAKKFGMFYYEFYNNLFLKILDFSIAGWFKSFASQSLQLHFIHLNSWEIKLEIKRIFILSYLPSWIFQFCWPLSFDIAQNVENRHE